MTFVFCLVSSLMTLRPDIHDALCSSPEDEGEGFFGVLFCQSTVSCRTLTVCSSEAPRPHALRSSRLKPDPGRSGPPPRCLFSLILLRISSLRSSCPPPACASWSTSSCLSVSSSKPPLGIFSAWVPLGLGRFNRYSAWVLVRTIPGP